MHLPHRSRSEDWPDLSLPAWRDTCTTLHLWTQIVGKVRLVLTPWTNHSWHVPLYVTARGLGTSLIPYGGTAFEMEFDFPGGRLMIRTTEGRQEEVALEPRTVADFYRGVMDALRSLGIEVRIHTMPSEIADAIPFEKDEAHGAYDREQALRLWHALVQVDRVFKEFRAGFIGKCSPVHFFWGSFDLAVTRFSGRPAPPHPGGVPHLPDWVAREAYSHEVSSAGFWPGGPGMDQAVFYSYAYPAPEGFASSPIEPPEASYSAEMGEFLLPYDAVRGGASPDETLLAFLQSTYEAEADLARWDRAGLERVLGPEGDTA